MTILKNLSRINKMSQQEKDVETLESLDNLIQTLIDYTEKSVIPRLPSQAIGNIKVELGLRHIAKDF